MEKHIAASLVKKIGIDRADDSS